MNSRLGIERATLAAMAAGLVAGGTIGERTKTQKQNDTLKEVDATLKAFDKNPSEQLGILMIAMALVVRRLFEVNAICTQGHRLRVMHQATQQFEKKLRKYCSVEASPPGSVQL